jgi:hypothetical protein
MSQLQPMSQMTRLHNEVFDFLLRWSEKEKKKGSERYCFYLRNPKDPLFRMGYWFPGNEEELYVSFWNGGDVINKSPNIFLCININQGISSVITSRDSVKKHTFLSRMAIITGPKPYSIAQHSFTSKIEPFYKRFDRALELYIHRQKIKFDDYLLKREKELYFEEFTQPISFISPAEFEENLAQVHKHRRELTQAANRGMEEAAEHESKGSLPIALKSIAIENYQSIQQSSVSDLPADAPWIFITGENGYGKTSLLQAIALGLNDNPELEKFVTGQTKISCHIAFEGGETGLVKISNRLINDSGHSNINYGSFTVGYGPTRLVPQAESSVNMEDKARNNVLGLFSYSVLMKNINYELFSTNITDEQLFRNLENAIREITDGRITAIEIQNREVYFTEQLGNGDTLNPLPFDKLASGFKAIINLAGDIIVRLGKLQQVTEYSNLRGIVLIDELENHLHPVLQREIPSKLSKVFPNIQFIASTHSPIPLLGAPKKSVILTVNRSSKEGSTIERLDDKIDFPSLLPDAILTSPVFGFQKIIPESHDENSFVRVEQTYDEVKANDERKEQIDNFLTGERKDALLKMLKAKK